MIVPSWSDCTSPRRGNEPALMWSLSATMTPGFVVLGCQHAPLAEDRSVPVAEIGQTIVRPVSPTAPTAPTHRAIDAGVTLTRSIRRNRVLRQSRVLTRPRQSY